MVIDVKFDTIDDPAGRKTLNNIPGVLKRHICRRFGFVGEVQDNQPIVREI